MYCYNSSFSTKFFLLISFQTDVLINLHSSGNWLKYCNTTNCVNSENICTILETCLFQSSFPKDGSREDL